jgi:transcriptional regulator with XRE-family HTH domain
MIGIAEQLRKAIRAAEKRGMTRYAIAMQTGLSQGMLSRFMAGKHVPNVATAEKIAKALGMRLRLMEDT